MASFSLRRAAGIAVVATVVGLVAPTPTAQAAAPVTSTAAHAPTLHTTLTGRAATRVMNRGLVDVVRGHLRVHRLALRHREIVLQSRASGAVDWVDVATDLTNRLGVAKFIVDPAADTTYRLSFAGSARLDPAVSRELTVRARPDVTLTADPSTIVVGDSTTLTGTVSSDGTPLVGRAVNLWAMKIGRPRTLHLVAAGTTDDAGMVVFTESPNRSMRYRLHVKATDDSPMSWSRVTSVRVTPAPATE